MGCTLFFYAYTSEKEFIFNIAMPSSQKVYDLNRFLEAQERDYATALHEIQNGRKVSHWIWYIFPQRKGLGRSYNSKFYALDGVDEARDYQEPPHPGRTLFSKESALRTTLTHKKILTLGSKSKRRCFVCLRPPFTQPQKHFSCTTYDYRERRTRYSSTPPISE